MAETKRARGGRRPGAGRKQILETEFADLHLGPKTKSDRSYCTNVRLPSVDADFVKTQGGGAFLRRLYIQWRKSDEGQKTWDEYIKKSLEEITF